MTELNPSKEPICAVCDRTFSDHVSVISHDFVHQKTEALTSTTSRPAYCKCAFTDPDGTFVPGEACQVHLEVVPQREALTSNVVSYHVLVSEGITFRLHHHGGKLEVVFQSDGEEDDPPFSRKVEGSEAVALRDWLNRVLPKQEPVETMALPRLEYNQHCGECQRNKITVEVFAKGGSEEPKAPPSDVEHLTSALVQQEGVLNECEGLLRQALDEGGVNAGFEDRLKAYWIKSAALSDWRTRDLALSSAKETKAPQCQAMWQPVAGGTWVPCTLPSGHVGKHQAPEPSEKASDEPKCCLHEPGGGFVCTLPKGHTGQHEAWGFHDLLQAWNTENGKGEHP
jgi:hypothetical protein